MKNITRLKRKYSQQVTQNTNFFQTIYHATDGIIDLFKGERNFRMHFFIAVLYCILGLCLRITGIEWIWLLAVIFFVLMAETINTIVETLVNLVVGRHYNILAKKVKDIAAGGVMMASIFAFAVMIIILVPIILRFI